VREKTNKWGAEVKKQEHRALVEFVQDYRDGIKVTKRGLSASPMICRKYGLKPGKVAVFTSSMGGRKAMSVFHFHPSCTLEKRKNYMRKHSLAARKIARQLETGRLEGGAGSMSAWWQELASDVRAFKTDIALSFGGSSSATIVH